VVKSPGPANAARPEQRTPPAQRTNAATSNRPVERRGGRKREQEPKSAFATELAKVL